jgi:hypothetical protein
LFSHLSGRDRDIVRASEWVSPGGWLVVTEPYQLDEANSPVPALARVLSAYRSFATDTGTDFTWIRRLSPILAAAGAVETRIWARPGRLGGAALDRWRGLIEPVADRLDVSGAGSRRVLRRHIHTWLGRYSADHPDRRGPLGGQ